MRTSPFLAAFLVAPALAFGQPMSAIDWLTDSVSLPQKPGPQEIAPQDDVSAPPAQEPITVRPLDGPSVDGVGLFSPASVGLPDRLWEASDPRTIDRLIARTPVSGESWAMRRLFLDLLRVSARPPAALEGEGDLLLTRIDRLLELGALDDAGALLEATDLSDPRLFRRWFDVRLLSGTEDLACDRLEVRPDLSPTFPTTIFCLARAGDWDAAALSLDTAEALGLISPAEDALLLRFLDETNAEEHGPLTLPQQVTPLAYRLFSAVGEPISTDILPRAFSHADLAPRNGWKARLEAAERLARSGIYPAKDLLALYRERQPAASGGVWDRAAAVQALDRALEKGDGEEIRTALRNAWSALAAQHLALIFVEGYGPALAAHSRSSEPDRLMARILLLAGQEPMERQSPDPALAFAEALAAGRPLPAPLSPLEAQVALGFEGSVLTIPLEDLLAEGRLGEATLAAVALVTAGAEGEADDLTQGLRLLRRIGLADRARSAALELLLLERRG